MFPVDYLFCIMKQEFDIEVTVYMIILVNTLTTI